MRLCKQGARRTVHQTSEYWPATVDGVRELSNAKASTRLKVPRTVREEAAQLFAPLTVYRSIKKSGLKLKPEYVLWSLALWAEDTLTYADREDLQAEVIAVIFRTTSSRSRVLWRQRRPLHAAKEESVSASKSWGALSPLSRRGAKKAYDQAFYRWRSGGRLWL